MCSMPRMLRMVQKQAIPVRVLLAFRVTKRIRHSTVVKVWYNILLPIEEIWLQRGSVELVQLEVLPLNECAENKARHYLKDRTGTLITPRQSIKRIFIRAEQPPPAVPLDC